MNLAPRIFPAWFALLPGLVGSLAAAPAPRRPNILIAISDDQSFLSTSIAGSKMVHTPVFDRVAREGVLFRNAFSACPSCSPARAALLTGLNDWQLEQAGTHDSSFPKKFVTFPDLLERAGYYVGYTGKGWAPGNWAVSGRTRNPAGPEFNQIKDKPPTTGIWPIDYAANFAAFLAKRPKNKPFCFWYGGHEPHRPYEKGSGREAGMRLADVVVPPFLPDTPEVRSDLLDYALEIEWFDTQLGRMLDELAAAGELDNTIVIVTSDNGMPFPRSKANCYEYGIHVPLAIRWGAQVPGGRTVDDLVGFVDLTATILQATGTPPPTAYPIAGRSLLHLLRSHKSGWVEPDRTAVYASRERHSSSRYKDLGYPQRALRTRHYLYIRNFRPERWPAGAPRELLPDGQLGSLHTGFHDIDPSPSLDQLIDERAEPAINRFLRLAVAKRPAEELYDVIHDPGCLHNLAADARYQKIREKLSRQLQDYLRKTGDNRVNGDGDVWETYPRYGKIRKFPPPGSGDNLAGIFNHAPTSSLHAATRPPKP